MVYENAAKERYEPMVDRNGEWLGGWHGLTGHICHYFSQYAEHYLNDNHTGNLTGSYDLKFHCLRAFDRHYSFSFPIFKD